MRPVLLSTLRHGGARLLSAALAIAISVGFVVATLAVLDAFQSTMKDQFAGTYSKVDAVVSVGDADEITPVPPGKVEAAVDTLKSSGEFSTVDAQFRAYAQLNVSGRDLQTSFESLPDEAVRSQHLARGEWPSSATEIALEESAAKEYGIALGDSLDTTVFSDTGERDGPPLTVTGLYTSVASNPLPTALIPAAGAADLGAPGPEEILLRGIDQATAQAAATRALGADAGDFSVMTRQDIIDAKTAQVLGDAAAPAGIVFAFTVVALLVASLVIANTFDVLIAQRTRQLALMRCLGATAGQIRGLVLTEGLVVGVLSALIGIAGGFGLALGLAALSQASSGFVALSTPGLRWWMAAIGLAVGVIVTLAAVSLPARKATRVSPLMAMRPLEAVVPRPGSRAWTLACGAVIVAAGGSGLAFAVATESMILVVAAAVVTGLGLTVVLRVASAPLIAGLARLVPGHWLPFRLAALGAQRHPGRTATTTIGMVIGVTIVATVMVGASVAQSSSNKAMDDVAPVDLKAAMADAKPVGDDAIRAVADTDGVRDSAAVPGTRARLGREDVMALGVNDDAAAVARGRGLEPERGTVLASPAGLEAAGLEPGQRVRVVAGDRTVELTAHVSKGAAEGQVLMAAADLARIAPRATASEVWAQLDEGVSAAELQMITASLQAEAGLQVDPSAAIQRAEIGKVITMLLTVVLALLGVAVLISIIGVANTLSLSVIERSRESSLLRALGLTRGQLRAMLACEAAQLTVVAAAIGLVAGTGLGIAGTAVVLGQANIPLVIAPPWGQFGYVAGAALLAGLLASVLPARRAARLTPSVGLAA